MVVVGGVQLGGLVGWMNAAASQVAVAGEAGLPGREAWTAEEHPPRQKVAAAKPKMQETLLKMSVL